MRFVVPITLVLGLAVPIGAQEIVWSATMTAGFSEFPDGASLAGYHPGVPVGEVDNLDFEFRGNPYALHTLVQTLSVPEGEDDSGVGRIHLTFNPGVEPESELATLSFAVDGEALAVVEYHNSGGRRSVLRFSDPGWRWEDGQVVQLELSAAPTPVPTLPLFAVVVLAAVLARRLWSN